MGTANKEDAGSAGAPIGRIGFLLSSWPLYMTILLSLGFTCWAAYSVYFLNRVSIYAENGPLENIQVLTLSIACLVFLRSGLCRTRDDRLLQLFFALLCFSFVLREVDVEDLNIPAILVSLGSGTGRNILLATGFVAVFGCTLLNIAHYKKVLQFYLFSKEVLLLVAAGILLVSGGLFEEMSFVAHHAFIEEILEFSGYVIILLVAFMWSKSGFTTDADGSAGTPHSVIRRS